MKQPDLSFESLCSGLVAGIDEAGRGPWAGPVVAAAVILDSKNIPDGINDSKKIPAPKRAALFEVIIANAQVGVGIATVGEIDTFNILGATMIAMQRSLAALPQAPELALVDGNRAPKLPCRVQTVVGGDAKCLSIAAASIIAKVTRDRIMQELALSFPQYGWDRNVGYGTVTHQQALVAHGITPHHRRSFASVSTLIEVTDLFSFSYG